jgi:hypothetical protein
MQTYWCKVRGCRGRRYSDCGLLACNMIQYFRWEQTFWRNAKAPLTLKIVTANSLKMMFTYKLAQHHNLRDYSLKLSLEFNMQRCYTVYSKTSLLAMHGQHISRFCIYLQIICKTT